MDKNTSDRIIFWMMIATFIMAIFVTIVVLASLHYFSFSMGMLFEKVGLLEELNPVRAGG